MILEVMKEQSLFSLFWVSSAHFALTQDNDSTAEIADRMGTQLKFASGKPMNFIHAVDGTEAARGNSVNEEIAFFLRGSPQRL